MKKQNELEEQKTEQSGNVKEATIYINPRTDFGFKRLFMEGLKAEVRLLDRPSQDIFPRFVRRSNTLGGQAHRTSRRHRERETGRTRHPCLH